MLCWVNYLPRQDCKLRTSKIINCLFQDLSRLIIEVYILYTIYYLAPMFACSLFLFLFLKFRCTMLGLTCCESGRGPSRGWTLMGKWVERWSIQSRHSSTEFRSLPGDTFRRKRRPVPFWMEHTICIDPLLATIYIICLS